MQDSNLTDNLLGSHITCFLLEEVTQNLLVCGLGVPLPVLAEFILQKSGDCGVGQDGCWCGWSMTSMSLPDQLQPCHLCRVPRAGVHVMHLDQDLPVHLQTVEIALHLSQKLAWRTHCLSQCIRDC